MFLEEGLYKLGPKVVNNGVALPEIGNYDQDGGGHVVVVITERIER